MATAEELFGVDIFFGSDFAVAANGDLQTLTGDNNIRSRLTRRTITEPGTLVHRPDFGVGLKRFLNSLNSLDNQRELANRIKVQWEQDVSVIEVLGIKIEVEDLKPDEITISVRANLVGVGEDLVTIVPTNKRVL